MFSKKLIVMILLFLTISQIASCNNNIQPQNKLTKITYWTSNRDYAQYHTDKVEEWNQLNPDKQINLETKVFESSQIKDKLWTTLHSGILVSGYAPPDLVDLKYQDFDEFVSIRNALFYPILNRQEINDNQFEAFTYRDLCFGIPYGMDKMVLYYNNDLLQNAGINIDDISTWQDVERYGRQYYEQTGKSFISIDAGHYDFFITLLTQKEIDYSNTSLGLESQKSVETIDYLTELVNENVAILMPGGRSDSKLFYDAFNNGEIVLLVDQLSNACVLSEKLTSLKGNIGITEIPQFSRYDDKVVWIPEYATAITMACENYKLLKDFLEFARLDSTVSKDMLENIGSCLNVPHQDIPEALTNSKYASFYHNSLVSYYTNQINPDIYMPNVTTVNVWLEGYEYELVERILSK